MGLPEIVDVARNFSVIIRVQGPDPKGLKMRKHAFHHYTSGKTTLSASGVLLPTSFNVSSEPMSLVLTVASIIEPFLSPKHRDHMSQVKPELISGAQIDIFVEGNAKGTPHWLSAELITLVDIPGSSPHIMMLINRFFDSKQKETQRSSMLESQSTDPTLIGNLGTRIAILKLSTKTFEDLPNLKICSSIKRGDLLLAIGAPFGVLSPSHFSNSISVGYVSNYYPPSSSHISLLMADIRCLPGMEGSPVFGEQSKIVGMLTRPLRQRGSGAEVQLVIPWEAIVTSCTRFLSPNTKTPLKRHVIPPNPIENTTSSICLITIGDGVWASGVLLNHHGLILTNAHLLEPWRFKKPHENHKNTISNIFFTHSKEAKQEREFNQRVQVRVDYVDNRVWCDANVVYVCKGPLDIAILKLEFVPHKLQPIVMDFTCPLIGSKVYVVGHGLFGPRCDFLPSACVGVVAKVVKTGGDGDIPAMIETTAAVHPGGSGGAILNSNGHMISLVTSNAKHGGGTVIPHLNFSIPCAALQPVFNFSKDMKDISILKDLDRPNEQLSSVWALMPPATPEPGPALPDQLPGLPGEEKKGSKFAKFIANRQEFLKEASPLDNKDGDSSKYLPSKL
ncbi:unnamed protein product [Lactuca virosa]|uniref:Glyoxysomal processing protease, glyoxysomal n=1 Tax=Lactuca virosa TaxID=75947 RepID=A0AAU9NQN4_9ASTR|nr:unnamed protein product [Lactuca virosa]